MKQIFFFSFLLLILAIPADLSAQNGIVRTYYDDGTIESEISYINDILDGISLFYYPNGNLREEIPFSYGKVNGIHRKYFQNGLIREERNLKEGILDGLDKIFHENGALKEALNYENGKLLKRISVPFDSTFTPPLDAYLAGNRQYKLSKEADIVSDAEICPIPINGIKEIQNNLVYPKETDQSSAEGKVTLSVKIDTLGNATALEVIKSLKKEYDLAAIKAVEKTRFLPGKKENKIVESKIVLNIEFKNENKVALFQEKEIKAKEIIPLVQKTEIQVSKEVIPVSAAKQETKTEPEPVKKAEPAKKTPLVITEEKIPGDDTPFPIGGIERVIARMTIPKMAVELKIEGEVIFMVEVDKYGVVRDTKLIKGLGNGIDEAVEIAILDSPFKAAKIEGKQVAGEVVLKIPFIYKK